MSHNPLDGFTDEYGRENDPEGPVRFCREVLGVTLDQWQLDVLREFGKGTRGISISACHGPGKTALACWCIVFSLLFRFPLKAVATAPSRGQLEGALMKEVAKWVGKLPPQLQGLIEVKSMSVVLRAAPKRSSFEARTARPENPEALQGIHEEEGWVLIIVDEASGVHEKLFESSGGSMAGENCQTMLLSNPTRTSGFFFDTHHKADMMAEWFRVTISHEDSARVPDKFVEEMANRYGRDSNAFRVRALGLFPKADQDTIIPYDLVESARARDIKVPRHLIPIWGVDIARFGEDSSAIVQRNAIAVLPKIYKWEKSSLMATAGRINRLWKDTPKHMRPSEILIDAIGDGRGVADRLIELGLPVGGINVSESAIHSDQYRNLRTELWFDCKNWLESRDHVLPTCDGGELCADRCVHDQLAAEMTVLKYDHTSTGKWLAESKKDLKKRGFKSPDLADALMMTFAGETAILTHGMEKWGHSHRNWNQPISREREMV